MADWTADLGDLFGDAKTGVDTRVDSGSFQYPDLQPTGGGESGGWNWWGSLGDFLKSASGGIGSFARGLTPIAQLATGGLGIASGIRGAQQAGRMNKMQERALEMQERAATPLTNYGESQLRQATAGRLSAPTEAKIKLWADGAKQKARDYLARAGITDSSTRATWESWIDQQAEAMREQALQGEAALGVDALGRGASAAAGAGQAAERGQAGIDALIQSANQALAQLAGGAA